MKKDLLKYKIANYISLLMEKRGLTQKDLSRELGINQGMLSKYINAKGLPNIEILMKLAELGGVSVDDIMKKDIENITILFSGNNNISAISGRDTYINTAIKKVTTYKYIPQPDDITPQQASRLQDLVNQIVKLETETKSKPKRHAAVWNTFKRKFKVGYYRELKQERFLEAEAYLMKWVGQLKKGLRKDDKEQYRKERYKAIFSAARNQLGWRKEQVDNFIYSLFEKNSIRDLSNRDLEKLYQKIMAIKQRPK